MDNKEIKIDVSSLAYNLSAIIDFIFEQSNSEKSSEIREVYEKGTARELELVQKSLAEVKSGNLDTAATIRYDIIRKLLDQVDGILMIDNFNDDEMPTNNSMDSDLSEPILSHLGELFALNTLINEGMLFNTDLTETTKDDNE